MKKTSCFVVLAWCCLTAGAYANEIQLILRPTPTEEISLDGLLPEDAQQAAAASALQSILRRAQDAQTRRDFREALQLYQQAERMRDFEDSPQRTQALMSLAEVWESLGGYEESIKTLQTVLESLDDDSSASERRLKNSILMRMARVYTLTGNQLKSRDVYLRLVQSLEGQERVQAASALIQLYSSGLLSGAQAMEIIEMLPQDDPSTGYLHARLAFDALSRGDTELAREQYLRALRTSPSAIAPSQVEYVFNLFSSLNQMDTLESVLKERLEQDAGDANAALLLTGIWRLAGKQEEALQFLEGMNSASPDIQERIATLAMSLGQYEQALNTAQNLLQKSPLNLEYHKLLGDVYFQWGKRDEAIRYWTSLPSKLGGSDRVAMDVVAILREKGLPNEALAFLDSVPATAQQTSMLRFERLDLLLETRELAKAWEEYVRLLRTEPALQATYRYRFMQNVVRLGMVEDFMPKLMTLAQSKPVTQESLLARSTLETLLVSQGKLEEALNVYLGDSGNTKQFEGDLLSLAQNLTQLGATDLAIKAYQAMPSDSSLFPRASFELGRLLVQMQRWDDARKTLEQVAWFPTEATPSLNVDSQPTTRALSPDSVQSCILLAEVLLHQKKTSDASNALHGLLQSSWRFLPEDEARTHLLLGHCYSQLGSLDKAQEEYETAAVAQDDAVRQQARFRLADMLFWRGEMREAQNAYRNVLEGDYSREFVNDALKRLSLYSLTSEDGLKEYAQADMFAWQGRSDDAINSFREIAARHSGSDLSLWALFRAAELLEDSGKTDAAKTEYKRLLEMTENVTLQGSIQMRLAGTTTDDQNLSTKMEEIILQIPDSVFADLARLRLQELPKPTAEPVN